MSSAIEQLANQEYKYGFVTDIEADVAPPGLNEDIVRLISAKKGEPEWLLEWRLKALRHWFTMTEPTWANVHYAPIDYQAIRYYSSPKQQKKYDSLDQVDRYAHPYFLTGTPDRARMVSLAAVQAGEVARPDATTLFCSVGLAGTDVAVAATLFT